VATVRTDVLCNVQVYESCFGSDVVKEVRQEMKAACAKCAGVSATAPGQAVPPPAEPSDKRKAAVSAVPPSFDATRLQQAILGFRSPAQQVCELPFLPDFVTEDNTAFWDIAAWSRSRPWFQRFITLMKRRSTPAKLHGAIS
jgi:hypothetical protein